MRLVGTILVVCLALALLRAAVVAIFVVVICAIVVSAICQPMKTFAGGFALICLGVIGQYPVAAAALLAVVAILSAILKG